jgi:hypothetical protein
VAFTGDTVKSVGGDKEVKMSVVYDERRNKPRPSKLRTKQRYEESSRKPKNVIVVSAEPINEV